MKTIKKGDSVAFVHEPNDFYKVTKVIAESQEIEIEGFEGAFDVEIFLKGEKSENKQKSPSKAKKKPKAKKRKQIEIKPTLRQKKALKIMIENGSTNKGIGNILKEAGYSDSIRKVPSKVTNSRSWNRLMEQHMPDSLIAKQHKKLLTSKRVDMMSFDLKVPDEEIRENLEALGCIVRKIVVNVANKTVWFWTDNDLSIKAGLDMAYKLKGKYAPVKTNNQNLNLNSPMEGKTDEELLEMLETEEK